MAPQSSDEPGAPANPEPPDPVEQAIAAACARFPEIAVAYLFGSVARDEARPWSDVDVGVVPMRRGESIPRRRLADLASRLDAVLARATDVVDLGEQGWQFCHRVLVEGRPVYVASEDRRVDFESTVLVRADDERPTFELATRGKTAAIRRWLESRR